MKIYYPEKRILEDFEEKSQTRFTLRKGEIEKYTLIERDVKTAKVFLEEDGENSNHVLSLNLYEVVMGPHIFQALIVPNVELNGKGEVKVYRMLGEREGIVDIQVK